jgi:hypothetical protein
MTAEITEKGWSKRRKSCTGQEACRFVKLCDNVVITIYRVTVQTAASSGGSVQHFRMTYNWMKTERGWRIIGGMSAQDKQTP